MQQLSDEENHTDTNQCIYYRLMQEVGIEGPYQTVFAVIACYLCVCMGFIAFGGSYYLAVAPYTNCPQPHEGITKCTAYVCSLPYQNRHSYQNQQISELGTVGNQFGDYHCSKDEQISFAKGMPFFGAVVGLTVASLLADNIGRRITLMLSVATTASGFLVIILAQTFFMAKIGLFLIGLGAFSNQSLSFCIISEIFQNSQRQKMELLSQAFVPVGGILASVFFYFFKNWRPIFIGANLVPLLICLAVLYFYLQETPQFLIKLYSAQEARNSLRFIARINGREEAFDESEILSKAHIQSLQAEYQEQRQEAHKGSFTYFDLFKYPSLRKLTIICGFFFFGSSCLYFAPIILIDQFGFDFFLNGIILNFAEIITYFYSLSSITTIQRKKLYYFTLIVSLLCAIILIFLSKKEICTSDCWTPRLILECFFMIVFRFMIALEYQVAFVNVTQMYPSQVGALGVGFACINLALPNVFLSQVVGALNRANFSVMAFFSIIALLCILVVIPLEQTYGRHPPEMIEQIMHEHAMLHKDRIHLNEQ